MASFLADIQVSMILNQMQIVTITSAALIGGVFLAMALAFGLGGREVAGQMLGDAYNKGQEQRGQVKQDRRVGPRVTRNTEEATLATTDSDVLSWRGHEEEAVFDRQAVAKERVRLDKDVTTEEERVSDPERIDVDDSCR